VGRVLVGEALEGVVMADDSAREDLSDEQARAIGVKCLDAWSAIYQDGSPRQLGPYVDDGKRKDTIAAGHAAYAACRGIVLKERDEQWVHVLRTQLAYWTNGNVEEAIVSFGRCLTQPPSKREQFANAAEAIMARNGWNDEWQRSKSAKEIVAAIYKEPYKESE
jgi:hypothetical protein